jgi:hypothetical protein
MDSSTQIATFTSLLIPALLAALCEGKEPDSLTPRRKLKTSDSHAG